MVWVYISHILECVLYSLFIPSHLLNIDVIAIYYACKNKIGKVKTKKKLRKSKALKEAEHTDNSETQTVTKA